MEAPADTKILKVPGFAYRGFDIPGLALQSYVIDELGTSKPAHELAPTSTPLVWRVGLYLVGRDLALGEEDAEKLPEPVKEAGRLVYSDAQERRSNNPSGAWHKDGVLYLRNNEAPKGRSQPPKGYVLAKYFIGIDGFEDGEIRTTPETREELIDLPVGLRKFIVPPVKGEMYHPITGTPIEVVDNEGQAIKRLMGTGLTEEQARKELSRSYVSDEGSGVAAVYSCSLVDSGPLCVALSNEPSDGGSRAGRFVASRSAERSEAPNNTGFRLLTEEEYRAYEADREWRERITREVNQ